jgi:hypothetical protein
MPVTHVNRYRDTYYLQVGRTKTGKPRYWFAKSAEGDLVESIPEGFEVYENPDSQVYFRKIVPQIVTPAEVAVVKEGVRRYAPGQKCLVDVRKADIIVYHSKAGQLLREDPAVHAGRQGGPDVPGPAMVLHGLDRRLDRPVGIRGDREAPGSRQGVLPHIGQDSFYELM